MSKDELEFKFDEINRDYKYLFYKIQNYRHTKDALEANFFEMGNKIINYAYIAHSMKMNNIDQELKSFVESKQGALLTMICRSINLAPKIFEALNKSDILKFVQVFSEVKEEAIRGPYPSLINIIRDIIQQKLMSTTMLTNINYFIKYLMLLPHKSHIQADNIESDNVYNTTENYNELFKVLYKQGIIHLNKHDPLSQVSKELNYRMGFYQYSSNDNNNLQFKKEINNIKVSKIGSLEIELYNYYELTYKDIKDHLVANLKSSVQSTIYSKSFTLHRAIEMMKELISYVTPANELTSKFHNNVLSLRSLTAFKYIEYINTKGEKIDETRIPTDLILYIKAIKETTISTLEMTPESINEPEMSSDEILSAFDLLVPVNNALDYWHQFLSGEVT